MVSTASATPNQPLDEELCLRLPPSLDTFNDYGVSLALALPTLEQRGELAAIALWRANEGGTVTAGELFKLLCHIEGSSDGNENAAERRRIIAAQHHVWGRLQVLADGHEPELAPTTSPDSIEPGEWHTLWADQVKAWVEHFFTMLGKFETTEGFDASSIHGLLSPCVKETLTRQTARELLDTPFLLGHTLHQNADRFASDAFATRRLASVLAITTLNAWHDTLEPQVYKLEAEYQLNLAFWHSVFKGFMYDAVHCGHNTLAQELNGEIHVQAQLHGALDCMPADSEAWKTYTRGPGAELNAKIAKSTGSELWATLEAQQNAL